MKEIYTKRITRLPDDLPSRSEKGIEVDYTQEGKVADIYEVDSTGRKHIDLDGNVKESYSKTITEPGTITIDSTEYGEEYTSVKEVNVTVDVPSSSASPAIMLKLKNGVTLPYTGHFDWDSYEFVRDREPISVLTTDIAEKIYGMYEIGNPMGASADQVEYGTFNLPFSFDYFISPGGQEGDYKRFIFTGVDVPGATITVDTTYFDIIELPSGYTADFSVQTEE